MASNKCSHAMLNQIHQALEPSMMKIHQSGVHIDLAAVWAMSANNKTPIICLQVNQQALWKPSSTQMPATQLNMAIGQMQCEGGREGILKGQGVCLKGGRVFG